MRRRNAHELYSPKKRKLFKKPEPKIPKKMGRPFVYPPVTDPIKTARKAAFMLDMFRDRSYKKIVNTLTRAHGGSNGIAKLGKEEFRSFLENYLKRYLDLTLLPSLADSAALVQSKPDNIDLIKLKYAEIDKVLKTAGMRPSESMSVHIEKMMNVNLFDNPVAKELLTRHVNNLMGWKPEDKDTIDVEVKEVRG